MNVMTWKFAKRSIATASIAASLFVAGATTASAQSVQTYSCAGQMANGWRYSALFLDGRFTQIRWDRSGQPTQTSALTRAATNSAGEPIYRGSFREATAVTLVDLGKGNVRPGSQVSVGVEEWGWARGTCSASGVQ